MILNIFNVIQCVDINKISNDVSYKFNTTDIQISISMFYFACQYDFVDINVFFDDCTEGVLSEG